MNLSQFDSEDVNLLVKWLYNEEPPPNEVLTAKVFDLLTLANFLLVDLVKEACTDQIRKVTLVIDLFRFYLRFCLLLSNP